MTTRIPRRPLVREIPTFTKDAPMTASDMHAYFDGEMRHQLSLVRHEHAVAAVAVEALKDAECPFNGLLDICTCLRCMALRLIEKSGWQP